MASPHNVPTASMVRRDNRCLLNDLLSNGHTKTALKTDTNITTAIAIELDMYAIK